MSTCWNCQAPVQAGDAACRACGTTLTLDADVSVKEPDLPCRTCGEATPYGALFCGNCGTRDPHYSPGVVELDRGAEEREANLVDAVEAPAPLDRTMVSAATLEAEVTHPRHRTAPPTSRTTVIDGGSGPVRVAEPAPAPVPESDTVQETQRPARRPKPTTHQTITKKPRALGDGPAVAEPGDAPRARPESARPKLSLTPAPRPSGDASPSPATRPPRPAAQPAAQPRPATRPPARPPARPPTGPSTPATTTPDARSSGDAGRGAAVARIAVKPAVVVTAPQPVAPAAPVAEPPGSEDDDLTEDIAEVRFFILQGLDDEARAAMAGLWAAHPGHPELEAVQRELDAAAPGEPPELDADPAEARVDAEAERRIIEVEDAELALTQAEQERLDEAERAERAEASARRITAEEIAAIETARLAADAARQAEREAQEAERAAVLARERADAKKREAHKAAAAADAAQRAAKRIAVSREVKAAVAERAKEAELAKAAEVARATEAARLARAAAEPVRNGERSHAVFEGDSAAAQPLVGADSSDIELGAVVDLVRRESAVLDLGESHEVDLRMSDPSLDEATSVRGRTIPTPTVPLDPYDDETTPAPGPAPVASAQPEALPEEAAPELVEELVLDRGRGSSGLLEVDLDDVEEILEDGELVEHPADDPSVPVVLHDEDLPPPEDLAVDLDDLDDLAPDPGPARTGRTIPPGLVTSDALRSEDTVITRGPQPARPFDDDPAEDDPDDDPADDDPGPAPRRPVLVSRTTVVPGDPSRPAEPAPYPVASEELADPFAAAAASGEFRSEEHTEPSPPPAPAAVVRTQEGTVIAPMASGKAGIPIAPIRLVALGLDGEPTSERTLGPGDAFEIGRQAGQPWAADTQMSVRHVKVRPAPGGAILDALGPDAAVFIKVSERSSVRDGDEFKVGQSQLRWQRLGPGSDAAVLGHLTVFKHGTAAAEVYPIGGAGLLLGRDEGDVVFPGDTFVSGHHCRFTCEGPGVYIEDLGSSNGTYLRVRSGEAVSFGSQLLVGHTQFVVEPG